MKLWQKLTDLLDPAGVNNEMVKRYKDTILNIKSDTINVYATYKGMDELGFHTFRDESNQRILLAQDTEYEVAIPKLAPGCYNTAGSAVHVAPIPARQWKRGLCRNNVQAVYLHGLIGNSPYEGNLFDSITFDLLDDSLQQSRQLSEAVEQAKEQGAVAINRNFAITLDPSQDTDRMYLYYHRAVIGLVVDKTITILNQAFRQEVLDSQRNWCPDFEVN